MSMQQSIDSEHPRSVRLIFTYQGDDVWLESSQPVGMTPPSDPIGAEEHQRGFWFEVRDVQGTVMHRRALHNPIRRHMEVFPPDPTGPISWVPIDRPQGAFAVLVPLMAGADHVALMAVPAAGSESLSPELEIHRVNLTGKS